MNFGKYALGGIGLGLASIQFGWDTLTILGISLVICSVLFAIDGLKK